MGDTNLLKWVSSQAKIKCLQCYHSKMIPYCHIWIIKCNSLQLKQNSRAKVSHYIIAFIPTKTEVNWSQHTSLSNLLQCLWQNLLYMYEKKFKRLLCRRNWMEHRWFLLENILSKSMNPSVFFFQLKINPEMILHFCWLNKIKYETIIVLTMSPEDMHL